MARRYSDKFQQIMFDLINKGRFTSREEISKYMGNLENSYFDDPYLMQKLKDEGVILKYEDVSALKDAMIEYFEQRKKAQNYQDIKDLNVVKIHGQEYLMSENGRVVTENKNGDIVKQIQDRQQEAAKRNISLSNEEALEQIRKDERGIKLSGSNDVNVRRLTDKEKQQFAAVMGMKISETENFDLNVNENLYINRNTGETYYVKEVNPEKLEVRRVTGRTVEQINDNVTQKSETVVREVKIVNLEEFRLKVEKMSKEELFILLQDESLTLEQCRIIKEQLRKIVEIENALAQKEETQEQVIVENQPQPQIQNHEMNLQSFDSMLSVMTADELNSMLKYELPLEKREIIQARLAMMSEHVSPVENEKQEEKQNEKGHQKVLLPPKRFNEPYNGFTSTLYFFLITFLFGIGMFIYLLLRIYL